MLDVDVGRTQLDGVGDDGVDQLDDRRVDARHRGFVRFLLLDLLDAHRLIELFDQAVDHRVRTQRFLNELVELTRRAEKRGNFAARRPAHALDRFLVQRIGHRQVDHSAVNLDRQHAMLPAKFLRQDLHGVLVDRARVQIDIIDPEGILDDLGDLFEGQDVAVDKRLRDVRLLLEAPPLDQLLRDAGHGRD